MATSSRADFDRLGRELGIITYRVADNALVPRDLVLGAVAELDMIDDVDLNTTSHEILADVFDTVGSREGRRALELGDLTGVADALIEAVREFAPAPQPLLLKADLAPHARPEALASSKLEAVNKISALTDSGPQALGPGSKEHRSVLENLHEGLGFGQAPAHLSKPALAEAITTRLGGQWDHRCWSTGYTITLEGLNRLLTLATNHLAARTGPRPEAEAHVLLDHLAGVITASFPPGESKWPGQWAVRRMRAAGFAHARQTEWPGWFFEFLALDSLMATFGGGPHRVPPVTFDYKANHIWDLKTHSTGGATLPLNDAEAIDRAVSEYGGVGFIVLHGEAGFDGEHEFWQWHTQMRRGTTDPLPTRAATSRRLKTQFTPTFLEALWLDADAIADDGVVRLFRQGRQADGSARRPKYQLTARASSAVRVAGVDLR